MSDTSIRVESAVLLPPTVRVGQAIGAVALGPRGEPGPQGDQSVPGATAYDLAVANQGYTGTVDDWLDSLRGETGPRGVQGESGATGPQGSPGVPGPQGDRGDVGPVGERGATGQTGPVGPQGPQGATGPQGSQGAKGDRGDAGPTGPQGETGPTGPVGPVGPVGPAVDTSGLVSADDPRLSDAREPLAHEHGAWEIQVGAGPWGPGQSLSYALDDIQRAVQDSLPSQIWSFRSQIDNVNQGLAQAGSMISSKITDPGGTDGAVLTLTSTGWRAIKPAVATPRPLLPIQLDHPGAWVRSVGTVVSGQQSAGIIPGYCMLAPVVLGADTTVDAVSVTGGDASLAVQAWSAGPVDLGSWRPGEPGGVAYTSWMDGDQPLPLYPPGLYTTERDSAAIPTVALRISAP